MPQPPTYVVTTYTPCPYCGGLTACSCPLPSAPMERALYKALEALRPSERSTLALGLSHWLNEENF